MIDFESSLVYFDCPLPAGSDAHAQFECGACDGNGDIAFYVGTLFSNLAIGAALCEAFRLGARWPYYLDAENMDDEYEWSRCAPMWRPGCGRTSP